MRIEYSKTAAKAINSLEKSGKRSLREKIEALTKIPPEGDITQLQGYSDGRKRLRTGKYRIIYKYIVDNGEQILYIIDIGSRGDIYK